MADQNETLPEGTDRIIPGASVSSANEEELIVTEGSTESSQSQGQGSAQGSTRDRVVDRVREGRDRLAGTAADKTRGLVGQGLERGSEALANVSKLVGGTAEGLEERLGAEYGDYARKAATAIEDVANKLASKDADELIDDTRDFVRKSPGVALAGAAIVGFALARLVKTGLDSGRDEDGQNRRGGNKNRGGGSNRDGGTRA